MFEKDTLVCILMAVVNLGISIVGGYYIGLSGVVLGTIISGLIPIIARPLYLYKEVLNISAKYYYKDLSLFMLLIVVFNIVVMFVYRKNKAFVKLMEYLKHFINLLVFKRR